MAKVKLHALTGVASSLFDFRMERNPVPKANLKNHSSTALQPWPSGTGVKIYLDPVGNVMNIWWGRLSDAYKSEEIDDPHRNDVIVKDKSGRPISLEVIGVFLRELNISDLVKKITGKSIKKPFLLKS